MSVRYVLAGSFAIALSACGGLSSELICDDNTDCVRGGVTGECLAPGHCAFADMSCTTTGLRWDTTASSDLAGQCVAGAGTPDGGFANMCGGVNQLPGVPGTACGVCDTGTWMCDGQEALRCDGEATLQTGIANQGTVTASSEYSSAYPVENAIDQDLTSAWYSDGPEPGNMPSVFRWEAPAVYCIESIDYTGNPMPGFGFASATVRVLDETDSIVFSQNQSLPNPLSESDPPFTMPTGGVRGKTVELVLNGHESNKCGGFAELEVFALFTN